MLPQVPTSDCKCHNPFSLGYDEDEDWHKVFEANLHALNETIGKENKLDLVLYGDSIIERMNGRVFGKPVEEIQDQLAVTKELFTKEGGGQIEALPLGIAGEEVSREAACVVILQCECLPHQDAKLLLR